MKKPRGFIFRMPGAPPSCVEGWYCPGCSFCKIIDAMRSCHSWYLVQTKFWDLMNVKDEEVNVWRERGLTVEVSGHYVCGFAGAVVVLLSTPRTLREGEDPDALGGTHDCDEGFERGMCTMRREAIKMHSPAFVSETQCKRMLKIVSEFVGSSIQERGVKVRMYMPETDKWPTSPWYGHLCKKTATARAMQFYQYSREWGPVAQYYMGSPPWSEEMTGNATCQGALPWDHIMSRARATLRRRASYCGRAQNTVKS